MVDELFLEYGLVKRRKDVLLGSRRIDISALVIQKCMTRHVKKRGLGLFFIPMSLLFNEGANKNFRPRPGASNSFSVEEIVDFENGLVFPDVGARNGFVRLEKKSSQPSSVPMKRMGRRGAACEALCSPTPDGGAWTRRRPGGEAEKIGTISVSRRQKPRQGMNTGGLNKVFVLEKDGGDPLRLGRIEEFRNGYGDVVELSTECVFPIIHPGLFGGRIPKKKRYILCLHGEDGRPLPWTEIERQHGVSEYLEKHKERMEARKGVIT